MLDCSENDIGAGGNNMLEWSDTLDYIKEGDYKAIEVTPTPLEHSNQFDKILRKVWFDFTTSILSKN